VILTWCLVRFLILLIVPEFKRLNFRQPFMKAVARATPEVLEAFRDDVWKLYESSIAQANNFNAWTLLVPVGNEPLDQARLEAESQSLLAALEKWVETFNLDIGAAFNWEAITTLTFWSDDPSARNELHWARFPHPELDAIPGEVRNVEFSCPAGWHPLEEYWREFEARIIREFKQYLADYRPSIIEAMRESGKKPVPVKRQRGGRPSTSDGSSGKRDLHFEWLALYQCRQWSYGKIAGWYIPDEYGEKAVGADAIRKAVQQAAKLVGLTLRPSKRRSVLQK
jgi:hypothetical protein